MERTKDPIITVRSTMRSKDSKGRDVITLYIGGEGERNEGQVDTLIAALTALKTSPKGVKLKIHTEKKEYEGRAFDSSFFFVGGVQDGAAGRAAPRTFKPVAATTNAETMERINKLKAGG
jgi:hypothetical protein